MKAQDACKKWMSTRDADEFRRDELVEMLDSMLDYILNAEQKMHPTLLESVPILDEEGELVGTKSVEFETPQKDARPTNDLLVIAEANLVTLGLQNKSGQHTLICEALDSIREIIDTDEHCKKSYNFNTAQQSTANIWRCDYCDCSNQGSRQICWSCETPRD